MLAIVNEPGWGMVYCSGRGKCPKREAMQVTETDITFYNKVEIKVQAQIFFLPAESGRYDIYLKNSITNWESAHMLDSAAKTFTLSQEKGRYVLTGS
ncbi:MAG: hypothetical protein IPK53_08985 [bacterium]|nr:hypothetical protein [bacterium]